MERQWTERDVRQLRRLYGVSDGVTIYTRENSLVVEGTATAAAGVAALSKSSEP